MKVTVSFTLDVSLVAELEQLAIKRDVRVARLVNELLAEALKKKGKK